MNTISTAPPSPFITPANHLAHAESVAGAVRFSDLAPQQIRWLWPNRIPRGRITLLVGDPGLGKSLLALDIAARVSRGTPWPDHKAATVGRVPSAAKPARESRMGEGESGREGVLMERCSDGIASSDIPPRPNPQSAIPNPQSQIRNHNTPRLPLSQPPPLIPCSLLPAPSSVLLLTAEDDFADTVRPRLEALGADCDRILGVDTVPGNDPYGVPRSFALNRDLGRLRSLVNAIPDCRLIVIDPIGAYLGPSSAEVQSLLHSLTTIARERDVAVLIVSHFRKKEGATICRTTGSLAFVAAARASWAVCKDPLNENRRLFMPVKNNLAPDITGLAYTIETSADHRMPTIHWSPEPVTHSLDFALAAARAAGRPDEERQHAIKWLKERLSVSDRRASEIREEADVQGISHSTLTRAFRHIGGVALSKGTFPLNYWYWTLPRPTSQNRGGEF